jgi:DNA-binding NtrC family response regulator
MTQYNPQPKETNAEHDAGRSELVIVDDDPGFSYLLKDYLLSAGSIRSALFSNGHDFLRDYRAGDTRKIILDYEFSAGPGGLEILKRIREINPLAVVIIVSAQDDLERAVETLRCGATDYFLKTNKTVFANILCSLDKIQTLERNKMN